MLKFKSVSSDRLPRFFSSSVVTFNKYFKVPAGYTSVDTCMFRDDPTISLDIPAEGEYLRDLGYFDKFHNNQVVNAQWHGTLTSDAVVIEPSPINLEIVNNATIHSMPPVVTWYYRSKPRGEMLVDLCPYICECRYTQRYPAWIMTWIEVVRVDGFPVLNICGASYEWRNNRPVYAGISQTSYPQNVFNYVRSHCPLPPARVNDRMTRDEAEASLRAQLAQFVEESNRTIREYLSTPEGKATKFPGTGTLTLAGAGEILPPVPAALPAYLTSIRQLCRHTWSPYDLSREASKLIGQVNDFDSNLIAYGADLKEIGGSVKSILGLVADIDNPKAWASAWLSMRFSDRLTISDTRELLESLKRALLERQYFTKGRSRMTFTESNKSYTFRSLRTSTVFIAPYSHDGLMTTVENLMRWDAWPTLENTWDMIPLSFVVDWFLPVSDLLQQIDSAIESPYLVPLSQYISEKNVITAFVPRSTGCSGKVEYSTYVRTPHNIIGDIRPFDWDLTPPSFSVTHLGDAVALAVQMVD